MPGLRPLFYEGDALAVLREFPDESIDCCMTSPPYWRQRQYASEGIGLEPDYGSYVAALVRVFHELHRVLKATGSFWLNISDTYLRKGLAGLPWRIALTLIDDQGWILRNRVVWHKVKGGPDNSRDKLRNVHEDVFHFVKSRRGYYYDVGAIRSAPRTAKVVNGAVVSATGVSGVRYRRQIELSTALNAVEKRAAIAELEGLLDQVRTGKAADFRMIIRGRQRTTHSPSRNVSGRAKEVNNRGFYFLRYDPKGSKPGDVWDIIPEDTQNRTMHYAPYPEDLCKLPLLATCPPGGVVLDPFCGTGTTNCVAVRMGHKSVGVEICGEYLGAARAKCAGAWTE